MARRSQLFIPTQADVTKYVESDEPFISTRKEEFKVKRIDLERSSQQHKTSTDLHQNRLRENDVQERDLQEAVRRRAYEIYEERGMVDGLDLEDWLQAESAILDTPRHQKAA